MPRTALPDPKELIIAKGTHKGVAFVTVGIIRDVNGHKYLVSTVGPKIVWSSVTKWNYLSDVASAYDIWGNASTPDPLNNIDYPYQQA